MAERHHQRNEHELGQTLGDGEGQRGLACCSPWVHKKSEMTGRLNNSNTFICILQAEMLTTMEVLKKTYTHAYTDNPDPHVNFTFKYIQFWFIHLTK